MKNELIQVDGKFYNKCKVVMLATEQRSILGIHNRLKLITAKSQNWDYITKQSYILPQHLYITSDEQIKEGDFFIQKNGGDGKPILRKLVSDLEYHTLGGIKNFDRLGYYSFSLGDSFLSKTDKKIIATTDSSLKLTIKTNLNHTDPININLPRPSNEFIQKFVDLNGKIEDILVEYEKLYYPKVGEPNTREDNGWGCPFIYQLKTSPDNTITIKPFKQKDSWSRKEVEELCRKSFQAGGMHCATEGKIYDRSIGIDKWIEENL